MLAGDAGVVALLKPQFELAGKVEHLVYFWRSGALWKTGVA